MNVEQRLGLRANVDTTGEHVLEVFDGTRYRTAVVEDGHQVVEYVRLGLQRLMAELESLLSDSSPEADPKDDPVSAASFSTPNLAPVEPQSATVAPEQAAAEPPLAVAEPPAASPIPPQAASISGLEAAATPSV